MGNDLSLPVPKDANMLKLEVHTVLYTHSQYAQAGGVERKHHLTVHCTHNALHSLCTALTRCGAKTPSRMI
jgi:hypothetical protein